MLREPERLGAGNKEREPARLRISIFRHAETRYNKENKTHRVAPDDADELTKEGIEEYREIAKEFAASISSGAEVVVYSSAFDRSRQSADIMLDVLKENGKKIKIHGLFKKTERTVLKDLGKIRNWHWKSVRTLINGGEAEYDGETFFVDTALTNPHGLKYPDYFTRGGITKIPRSAMKRWPAKFIKEIQSMETYFKVTRRMMLTLEAIQRKHSGENCHVVVITHRALMYFLGDFFTQGAKTEFNPAESIELEERGDGLVVTRVGEHDTAQAIDIFEAFKQKKRALKKGQAVNSIGEVMGHV